MVFGQDNASEAPTSKNGINQRRKINPMKPDGDEYDVYCFDGFGFVGKLEFRVAQRNQNHTNHIRTDSGYTRPWIALSAGS